MAGIPALTFMGQLLITEEKWTQVSWLGLVLTLSAILTSVALVAILGMAKTWPDWKAWIARTVVLGCAELFWVAAYTLEGWQALHLDLIEVTCALAVLVTHVMCCTEGCKGRDLSRISLINLLPGVILAFLSICVISSIATTNISGLDLFSITILLAWLFIWILIDASAKKSRILWKRATGWVFHLGFFFFSCFVVQVNDKHPDATLVTFVAAFLSACWLVYLLSHLEENLKYRKAAHNVEDLNYQIESYRKHSEARIEKLRNAAKRSHQLQREFLATMSHELRTPLSCIVGLARLWGRDGEIPIDARKDMGTVERMAIQLLRIVDDGLSFVRQEGKESQPILDLVQMRNLVNDLHSIGKWLAAQKNNRFLAHRDKDIPSLLIFDERRTRQTIINLLSNAARYCEGGEISLDVALTNDNNQEALCWTVRDSGRGMGSEEIRNFFEPFTKSRDSEGLGLGLTLVRRMVDEMGGRIDLRSKKGVGTIFSVSIPVKREEVSTLDTFFSGDSGSEDNPSQPMDLRPDQAYGELDFPLLRELIRLGQITEIGEWIDRSESIHLNEQAKQLAKQLRRALLRVDLSLMLSLIDQVDSPLGFSESNLPEFRKQQ